LMAQLAEKGIDIKDLIARANSPIRFIPTHGGNPADGYEATILPDICAVIIDAGRQGKLGKRLDHLAERCAILQHARTGGLPSFARRAKAPWRAMAERCSGVWARRSTAKSWQDVWYNFVKMHRTLRMTPALSSGVADHLWSMDELVALVDEHDAARPRQKPGRKAKRGVEQ
jgi:hypothetical protein